MIKKIILHNFKSYDHIEIDFPESSVVAIIGESDQGKTNIFRGHKWLSDNYPLGTDMVSHWALKHNPNGTKVLTDDCYVTEVYSDNRYVTRAKERSGFNGYRVGTYKDGEFLMDKDGEYAKANKTVPAPVKKIINMDEVNIQEQHDSMFLLSKSGPEVARFFNKLIHLEDADTAMKIGKSKKRTAMTEVKNATDELNDNAAILKGLQWVDQAEVLSAKIEKKEEVLSSLKDDQFDIEELVDNMTTIAEECEVPVWVNEAKKISNKITSMSEKMLQIVNKKNEVSLTITNMESVAETITDSSWRESAISLIEKIYVRINSVKGLKSNKSEITDLNLTLDSLKNDIKKRTKEIGIFRSQLPEVCPLCKGKGKLA